MAHEYNYLYKLPATGLRFFTVYGPWSRPDTALFKFTKFIIEQKTIHVFNHGNHSRDYTYIVDVVVSIIKAVNYSTKKDQDWKSQIPDSANSMHPGEYITLGITNQ